MAFWSAASNAWRGPPCRAGQRGNDLAVLVLLAIWGCVCVLASLQIVADVFAPGDDGGGSCMWGLGPITGARPAARLGARRPWSWRERYGPATSPAGLAGGAPWSGLFDLVSGPVSSPGDRRIRLANKALQLTSGTAIIKPGAIIVLPPAVGRRIIEGRVLRACSWCRRQLSAGR